MGEFFNGIYLSQEPDERLQITFIARFEFVDKFFDIFWDISIVFLAYYLEGKYQMSQQTQQKVLLLNDIYDDVAPDFPQEFGGLK